MDLPIPFEQSMRRLLGGDYENFRQALLSEPTVSIRLNPYKWNSPLDYERVPWASEAYYLPERPPFTYDPLFHGGCYYVQEASSMFVEQAVRQHLGAARVALDLCAAPGGKSTLLRSLLPDDCVLVSNEVVRSRAQVLAENMTKWGHSLSVVTSNYPADFMPLGSLFDLILVDAPCSGEGMFRKDPVAVAEWSPENVAICWQRQRDILADIWPTLRPGGLLVYSTCTFNTEEDEENVRWIQRELGAELLPVAIDPSWSITPSFITDVPHVYRFLPGRTRGEGLFLAVLRKGGLSVDEGEFTPVAAKRKSASAKNKGGKPSIPLPPWGSHAAWVKDAHEYLYRVDGERIVALPAAMESLVNLLSAHLRVLKAGITMATLKGRDVIPTHELAMSSAVALDAFTTSDLSYAEALRYLHGEAVVLPPDVPRGYVVVTYRGVPLGFVKHLGNRANNLYPNEWRIRSGHFPEKEVLVV